MNENLAANLSELCEYLSFLGYHIPPDFMKEFFDFYAKTNLENWKLEEMGQIFAPMIVRSKEEDQRFSSDFKAFFSSDPFPVASKKMQKKKQKYERQLASMKQEKEDMQKNIETFEKKLDRLKNSEDKPVLNQRKRKILEKRKNALGEEWTKIALEENKVLDLFHDQLEKQESFLPKELDDIDDMLKNLLKKAVFSEKSAELMEHIDKERKLIKDVRKKQDEDHQEKVKQCEYVLRETREMLQRQSAKYEQMQKEWKKEAEQIFRDEMQKAIEKRKSAHHREEFTKGKNTVKVSEEHMQKTLDKPFKQLTPVEKEQIRQYIRENTKKFRTKMVRNMRCRHDKNIDMEDTCKKSCATDGIPMRLSFVKERPQRAKLFLLLDVSGSCKHASEMMLLFIYYMKEAFPGGCNAYAFTNKLYDLSDFFEELSGDEMAKAALAAIPRSGAYSDYNKPLRALYEEHLSEIDKDTLFFVIGDARNNKNPSGEHYFKTMARKAKKVFWMNTDDLDKWDQGDSIISTYAPYTQILKEVKTPAQLIQFLTEIRG